VLEQAGFAVPAQAASTLGGVQSITKSGERVTVDLGAQMELKVRGDTPVRIGPEITFALQDLADGMALADIAGVAVHKFMWIDLQKVQFRETAGRRTVRVDTNFGGKEFVLP
jgi:hypothetical protein